MHLKVFFTEPLRRASVTTYTQLPSGEWEESNWFGDTLEDAARAADLDLGEMDGAYQQLVELGVEKVSLTSYTAKGMDTNDPAKAKLWHANVLHPQNSGMSHHGKGKTAGAAILDAARVEANRQKQSLEHSIAYHERQAARLREQLKGAVT
jgi:hypothetical protein